MAAATWRVNLPRLAVGVAGLLPLPHIGAWMGTSEHLLAIACALSGVAWAVLGAWRAGGPVGSMAARGLLGGVGAAFLASAAYDLLGAFGDAPTWEALARGDAGSVAVGATIGLVEEGAKLTGLLLAVELGMRRRQVAATALGVAAGFAAVEAAVALRDSPPLAALALRVALAPAAHALLAIPLAIAVALGVRRGGWAWLALAPALGLSAALHGAGDLSLTLQGAGRAGYALALLVPLVLLRLSPVARPRFDRLSASGASGRSR